MPAIIPGFTAERAIDNRVGKNFQLSLRRIHSAEPQVVPQMHPILCGMLEHDCGAGVNWECEIYFNSDCP